MQKRFKAPSPALVISLIALFVALGGTTYAATSLPANSVGTAQLKNNAVTPPKIAEEAWHQVGASGQPAFENGWHNTNPGLYAIAGFYKDPLGVVHLKGAVNAGTGTIFTLPAAYRPSHRLFVAAATGVVPYIRVTADGGVSAVNATGSSGQVLDGVTFRVGE